MMTTTHVRFAQDGHQLVFRCHRSPKIILMDDLDFREVMRTSGERRKVQEHSVGGASRRPEPPKARVR